MTRKDLLQEAVESGLAETPSDAADFFASQGLDLDEMLVFESLCEDRIEPLELIEVYLPRQARSASQVWQ